MVRRTEGYTGREGNPVTQGSFLKKELRGAVGNTERVWADCSAALPADRYLPAYVSLSVLTEILRLRFRMTVEGGKERNVRLLPQEGAGRQP